MTVEGIETQTVKCPGCGKEHTSELDEEMYSLFGPARGEGIEDNILNGTAKFNCWKCMQKVEADTRLAFIDWIDEPEEEVRKHLETQREELEPPRFVEELSEEDREMAEERKKMYSPMFPAEVEDLDEWYDQFD
jgi:DNA repair exonuclease SbcCD ATPase subunit